MVSAVGTRKNISVIDCAMTNNVKIEVLQYDKLKGVTPTRMAMNLHYMEQNDYSVSEKKIILHLKYNKNSPFFPLRKTSSVLHCGQIFLCFSFFPPGFSL